jgi:tRNA(Ile)-lysidine synthase
MVKRRKNGLRHPEPRPVLRKFARRLFAQWTELDLPTAGEKVIVAVSGGADSCALLLALDELIKTEKLRLKLIVAHLDHGLRNESRKDAAWVSKLARELGHDVVTSRANLKKSTSRGDSNLEQAARKARYDFLRKTANQKNADYVLTAHTLDDQAETILLRLLRGSAAEGLSGTSPVRFLAKNSEVRLVRPLISWARRTDTEDYCQARKVEFRIDEMNDDETFSRVRVRKQLLPLMKSFNNRIVEALSRTAKLLNEDAVALSVEAKRLLELASQKPSENSETQSPPLSVKVLLEAPAATRRRALREWILRARGDLNRLEMVHFLAVEHLLEGERGGRVAELPAGMKVTRRRGMLELSSEKGLKKTRAISKIQRS